MLGLMDRTANITVRPTVITTLAIFGLVYVYLVAKMVGWVHTVSAVSLFCL